MSNLLTAYNTIRKLRFHIILMSINYLELRFLLRYRFVTKYLFDSDNILIQLFLDLKQIPLIIVKMLKIINVLMLVK